MSQLKRVFGGVALALLVLVATLNSFSHGERARFDNYRLYKVKANTAGKLALLRSMESSSDSLIFLDDIRAKGGDVHIVVAPHKVPDFLQALSNKLIFAKLLEKNFQSILDTEAPLLSERRSGYNWKSYHSLNETYDWLKSLARAYPGVVTVIEGGKSYEGRRILGVKIAFNRTTSKNPSSIFIEAGIHAREWIGPATATYIINQLLTSNNTEVKSIARKHVWYIFPHSNPDGYEYTRTTYRLWRKTRAPYDNGCFGADPNRNWDFYWNKIGASSNPCSDTYAGPRPFSEIEAKSMANFISSLKGEIDLYISFHSYSQYLLYPYGAVPDKPKNDNDLRQIFNATVEAIATSEGTVYTGGNIYSSIYPTGGSSVDWAYNNIGIKLAFVFELRPSSGKGYMGFKLPPSEIEPTGAETLDGIVAMIKESKKLGYFRRRK